MEVEDDLGIKRGAKKRLVVPNKIYIIIKISLIAAIPVVYFICSPLLAVVILAYFGLIVITNNIEKNFNLGLKKDLHIHLPKTKRVHSRQNGIVDIRALGRLRGILVEKQAEVRAAVPLRPKTFEKVIEVGNGTAVRERFYFLPVARQIGIIDFIAVFQQAFKRRRETIISQRSEIVVIVHDSDRRVRKIHHVFFALIHAEFFIPRPFFSGERFRKIGALAARRPRQPLIRYRGKIQVVVIIRLIHVKCLRDARRRGRIRINVYMDPRFRFEIHPHFLYPFFTETCEPDGNVEHIFPAAAVVRAGRRSERYKRRQKNSQKFFHFIYSKSVFLAFSLCQDNRASRQSGDHAQPADPADGRIA